MASQPTFVPYTPAQAPIPLPAREFYKGFAPKPNIRIAYIAGDAATAIHRGMASFTETKRESTLEELAIAGLTDELIAAGRELLSPAMYAAFLRWGEAASHLSTRYETDGDGNARCDAFFEACAAINDVVATNIHDLALKTHLISTELSDCPDFYSMRRIAFNGRTLSPMVRSVGDDTCTLSPVLAVLDNLADLAWDQSPADLLALAPSIVTLITSAFSAARGELDLAIPAPRPLPAVLGGYSPYMRGPLVAWRKAYAVYEAATAEFKAYDREWYTPANERYLNLTKQSLAQTGEGNVEAALAEAGARVDEAQERFDELLDQQQCAIDALYRIPAPGPAELAVKLSIFNQQSGWELNNASDVVDRLTTDARRFGRHGAFLQTDEPLLEAFSTCRHEMQAAYADDNPSPEENDAHFARRYASEDLLTNSSATTIEGVIAKLRVAFAHLDETAWSDHAVMNPTMIDFRNGLANDGNVYKRMAWGAVQDLARIGGINLAEQGA